MRAVDDKLTSVLGGLCNGVDIYYNATQYYQYFPNIDTNTLYICDIDDPVIGGKCIPPPEDFLANKKLALLKTQKGGHIAYFESMFDWES